MSKWVVVSLVVAAVAFIALDTGNFMGYFQMAFKYLENGG